VDSIQRSGADVILRFAAGGADAVTATLHATYGAWTGELTEGGRTRPVILLRRRP
jgi:hypothetical protein